MSIKNVNFEQLLKDFNKNYEFIYENESKDYEVAGVNEAIKCFDEYFIKKHKDIVLKFNEIRQDILLSDREVASFMFAIEGYDW